jgi:hypothetical protein
MRTKTARTKTDGRRPSMTCGRSRTGRPGPSFAPQIDPDASGRTLGHPPPARASEGPAALLTPAGRRKPAHTRTIATSGEHGGAGASQSIRDRLESKPSP